MEKSGSIDSAATSPQSPQSTLFASETLNEELFDVESQQSSEEHTDRKLPWILKLFRSCRHSDSQKGSSASDDLFTRLRTRKIEETPEGYPRLACFLSSDHNFSTYRGFSYLHARLLLDSQEEIRTLEKKLDDKDKEDYLNSIPGKKSGLNCRGEDVKISKQNHEGSRQALLGELKRKLLEYDELLLKAREVNGLQQPSNRDYRSVRNWMGTTQPLAQHEQTFIEHREDVITLRHGRECAGFDGLVEDVLQRLPRVVTNASRYPREIFKLVTDSDDPQKLFLTPELREKTSGKDVRYFSASRVDLLVNILITVVIFVLLVIPVLSMYHLINYNNIGSHRTQFQAIGILIVFTLVFGAAMSILTRAARHELFAASAAYCAVLVVFIGNFSNLA